MAEPVGVSFDLVPEKQVLAAALNPVDRIGWPNRTQDNINLANRQVRESVYEGIVQGKGYPEVARELKDKLDISATKAKTIAQTEGHRAREMGKLAATQEATEMGVKFKRRWVATLDQNTRDTHGDMDGQEIDVYDDDDEFAEFTSPDGGTAAFPGGFGIASEDINCRCTTIDIVEGYEPTSRRARLDEEEYQRRLEEAGFDKSLVARSEVIDYTTYRQYAEAKGWPMKYKGAEPRVAAQAVPTYVSAKTREEAEAWATQNLVEKPISLGKPAVNYRGIDLETANIINQRIKFNIDAGMPKLKSIHAKAIRNDSLGATMGYGLEINSTTMGSKKKFTKLITGADDLYTPQGRKMYDDLVKNIDQLSKRDQWAVQQIGERLKYTREGVGKTIGSVIDHEMMHKFADGYHIKDDVARGLFKQQLSVTAKESLSSPYKYKLSAYGGETAGNQVGEHIAEAYTAYRMGEISNLHPDFVAFFRRYLR